SHTWQHYLHTRRSSDLVTVRVRGGEMSVTDGPFIETKEALGGFILIDAKDLNDAIRVAAGIPLAKLGAIEVRPIHEFG
ncbi:YciI family protein, partial [Rhizobium ruizarguesonis]